MDLGIRGKRALVCAGSKGLGRGCAEALAEALLRGEIKSSDHVEVIRRDNSDELLFQLTQEPKPALTTSEEKQED
mgnify:CR=1 FL=1